LLFSLAMKRPATVFVFLIFFLRGYAQKIQAIVPKQVVAGNAFQIQYIIAEPSSLDKIDPPQFDNLRLISGPNFYKGNSFVNGKTQAIENIAYTVVPLNAGMVKISPLIVKFKNGDEENSNEIVINVIPQPKASFNVLSTYTDVNLYAPSSKTDLDKLIEANLFIKAEVNKRICFLGEAITATFKLYSRLQSTSEVIKAPGLYGFSVMDMLNINEAHQAVETINGKVFNTSVLRKLQLYPAQTGKLTIDEMQLQNTIEFDDSATGKKIKVEKELVSNPVEIVVKSLLSKQIANYAGAVGQFSINAHLQNSKITANAQGKLTVIISGKGNFIQLGPPAIYWPKRFDVFDPVVVDELNKNMVPTEGNRKYIFAFTNDRPGNFTIPPISFSFFDPSSKKWKETSTDSIKFEIVAATENKNLTGVRKVISNERPWMFFLLIMALIATVIIIFRRRKKHENIRPSPDEKIDYIQKLDRIKSQQMTDKQFCSEIQKLLTEVNKEYNLSREQEQELQSLRKDCQLLIYSDINSESKKGELQKRTEIFLKQMQT
jgi:hypothetical protein